MSDKSDLRNIFLHHTLLNAGGIIAGQLIMLFGIPILARKYTSSEFGIYASLVAVCNVFGTSAALRFDMALPATLPGEMSSMYRLSLLACAASLLFGTLAVALNLHRHIPWPQPLAATALALLCVVTGTLQALVSISNAALVRRGQFLHTALLRIFQPAAFITAALLMLPGGLPAAFAISLVVAALSGLALSRRQLIAPACVRAKQVARKYWEFPVLGVPMSILDSLALAMPLLFIVQHYGNATGGNYSQVQRLAAAPLILCAGAIAQVFYKHAGDLARAGQSARPLMWQTVGGLSLIGVTLILLTALVGEPVFSLLLGKGWRTDSQYLLLMLVPAVFRMSVSPVTSIFPITRQNKLGALWQVIYMAATWSMLSYASTHLSLDGLLLAILINELILYAFYLWLADLAARRFERTVIQCAV